jgi:hypothetical protein
MFAAERINAGWFQDGRRRGQACAYAKAQFFAFLRVQYVNTGTSYRLFFSGVIYCFMGLTLNW